MLRLLLAAVGYPNVGAPLPQSWQEYQSVIDWIERNQVLLRLHTYCRTAFAYYRYSIQAKKNAMPWPMQPKSMPGMPP